MQNHHPRDLHVVRGREVAGRRLFVVWRRWNVSVFTVLICLREETRQVPTVSPPKVLHWLRHVFVLRALNETMHSWWHSPGIMPSLLQHLSRGLLCFFIHPSTHHVRYSGRKGFIHQPILSQHPQAHTDEENRGVENAAFLLICSRDHSSQFCGQNKLAVKSRKIFGAKIGEADIAPSCQPVHGCRRA